MNFPQIFTPFHPLILGVNQHSRSSSSLQHFSNHIRKLNLHIRRNKRGLIIFNHISNQHKISHNKNNIANIIRTSSTIRLPHSNLQPKYFFYDRFWRFHSRYSHKPAFYSQLTNRNLNLNPYLK